MLNLKYKLNDKISKYEYNTLKIASKRCGCYATMFGLLSLYYVFGYYLKNVYMIILQACVAAYIIYKTYKFILFYKESHIPKKYMIIELSMIAYMYSSAIIFPILCVDATYENSRLVKLDYSNIYLYLINVIILVIILIFMNYVTKMFVWKKLDVLNQDTQDY